MRERDIEAYLVQRVRALGGEVRKVAWIGRRGAPDRVVMLPPGRAPALFTKEIVDTPALTLWVELKAPGEKPQPHQVREHARMQRMGQTVLVIDSIDGVDWLLGKA